MGSTAHYITTGLKMTRLRRRLSAAVADVDCNKTFLHRVSTLSKSLRHFFHRVRRARTGGQYSQLLNRENDVESGPVEVEKERERKSDEVVEEEEDLVCLKISLLGDRRIGKTSFVAKYVGEEQDQTCLEMNGLNLMMKTLLVKGARIAFRIWDVGGDYYSNDQIPIACKDADAIFFMFDLTSRCTLQSVIGWYKQARMWNQTAIPVLIGTKFDDFTRFPLDLQLTVVNQARAYARAMQAALFFSSSTHNINVNKVFKFTTARLFNIPWTVKRNLTIGEPIIDY
ncbi:Septum-promoting GTP-binding protein 1-like protein [Drosera capensis]